MYLKLQTNGQMGIDSIHLLKEKQQAQFRLSQPMQGFDNTLISHLQLASDRSNLSLYPNVKEKFTSLKVQNDPYHNLLK